MSEWVCTWPRFEKEAKSNTEMGCPAEIEKFHLAYYHVISPKGQR